MNGHTPKSTKSEAEIANEVADRLSGQHRDWIEEFARNHDSTYEEVMEGAVAFLDGSDSYGVCFGTDLDYDAANEFWEHYEQVMGVKVPEGTEQPFRCAC